MKKQSLLEGPYDQCLSCRELGNNCDGPNFLAMTTERWCSWCKKRKISLSLTNEELAAKANVSIATIEKIMAGMSTDVRVSTMQSITKALLGDSWGEHPCPNPEPSVSKQETEYLKSQLKKSSESEKDLRETLNILIDKHSKELSKARADSETEIGYLKKALSEQKKTLRFYRVLVFVIFVLILVLFIAYLLSARFGWFGSLLKY